MSVIKHITYREHLPILLGQNNINLFPVMRVARAHKRPTNTRFAKLPDPGAPGQRAGGFTPAAQDDPSIRQEFVTAAYRFGHAMLTEELQATDGSLQRNIKNPLKDNYFDPDMVFKNGPGGCLRGAMMGPTNQVSGVYSDATQNNLFKPNNFKHGVDLLAINLAVSGPCPVSGRFYFYLLAWSRTWSGNVSRSEELLHEPCHVPKVVQRTAQNVTGWYLLFYYGINKVIFTRDGCQWSSSIQR